MELCSKSAPVLLHCQSAGGNQWEFVNSKTLKGRALNPISSADKEPASMQHTLGIRKKHFILKQNGINKAVLA